MGNNGTLENIDGTLKGTLTPTQQLKGTLSVPKQAGGGTDDYEQLKNKPTLNGVTIEGSKNSEDYNMTLSVQEIEKILYLD